MFYSSAPREGLSCLIPSTLYTFSYTTTTIPPPLATQMWLHYKPGGRDCYDMRNLQLPACSWVEERPAGQPPVVADTRAQATSLLLHPNPAQDVVNVSYVYAEGQAARSIKVYDALGRLVAESHVSDASGTITIPLARAAAGIYMVKMEENGRMLHVQRLVVSH